MKLSAHMQLKFKKFNSLQKLLQVTTQLLSRSHISSFSGVKLDTSYICKMKHIFHCIIKITVCCYFPVDYCFQSKKWIQHVTFTHGLRAAISRLT